MDSGVDACYDSQEDFDYLKLYIDVSLGRTLTDRLNDSIYQESRQLAIALARDRASLRVDTVILAVAVKEFKSN